MYKRKKQTVADSGAVSVAPPGFDGLERDMVMDNLLKTLGSFGFLQVFPPPLEERRLYLKQPDLQKYFGQKIMNLPAHGSRELILSPTLFISLLKRYAENVRVQGPHVAKWFYAAPVMDVETSRPSHSHELGLFVLGDDSSMAAAQLINTVNQSFAAIGLADLMTEVNSFGCSDCQKDYLNILQEHLRKSSFDLCPDCRRDVEGNPMAVWRCDKENCRAVVAQAPQIVDFLDESCRATLVGLLETIDQLGIPYTLSPGLTPHLVKERIAFRLTLQEGKVTLGNGGDYVHLAQYLGAEEPVPLLGFLTNFEALWEQIAPENRKIGGHVEVFMIPLGEAAARKALLMHRALRDAGIYASESILGHSSIKSQLKEAVARTSDIAVIIGQKEAREETAILRDLRSGIQEVFASDRIIEEVKKRLGR